MAQSNPAIVGHQGAAPTLAIQQQSRDRTSESSASRLLPRDRDASANWSSAETLSVGGIPTRTTICATVKPLGSAKDDTANIQNAIAFCPLGQVVQLGAGAFTIAEGKHVMLSRG